MRHREARDPSRAGSAHVVLLGFLLLAGSGVLAFSLFGGEADTPRPASTGSKQEAPAPRPEPEAMEAPVTLPEAPEEQEGRREPLAYFPNGTTAPLLNSVGAPVDMRWPDDQPWSPIARKLVDENGMEWYLHEDGSFSTTVMANDAVNDQQVPTGLVFNQRPVAPLVLDEPGPRMTPSGMVEKN